MQQFLQIRKQPAREKRRGIRARIDDEIHIAVWLLIAASVRPKHSHVRRAVFHRYAQNIRLFHAQALFERIAFIDYAHGTENYNHMRVYRSVQDRGIRPFMTNRAHGYLR